MPDAERNDFGDVIIAGRLRDALTRLNLELPAEALDDAFRQLVRVEAADLVLRNRAMHRLLVDGVSVEYRDADGTIRGAQARVIDFDDPSKNDWLAVNQFSVVENKHNRRPDVVLLVNGLPLAVFELKNAASDDATIWSAYQQLQTYKAKIPSLFAANAALVISDGVEARVGTLTAGKEWFKPWRTITGETQAEAHQQRARRCLPCKRCRPSRTRRGRRLPRARAFRCTQALRQRPRSVTRSSAWHATSRARRWPPSACR
jgi:type I restriction enzyme R subunit